VFLLRKEALFFIWYFFLVFFLRKEAPQCLVQVLLIFGVSYDWQNIYNTRKDANVNSASYLSKSGKDSEESNFGIQ